MRNFFSNATGRDLRQDLLIAMALAFVSILVWCSFYDRWTIGAWQTPITYLEAPEKIDVISLFAGIKAASEGHIQFFFSNEVPELGAPHVANWNDYPLTEKPLIILTGWLARGIGIFAAANVALLFVQVLAALSFYAAARLLGGSWIWSFAGGMIFAFSRYAFAEGLHHLTVSCYWHVPLDLLVVIWMMRQGGLLFGTGRFRFALFVAAITGMQNIYYTSMFAQFILFSGLLQAWQRGWKASLPALAIIGTAACAFLLMNANTFVYSLVHGANGSAVVRGYQSVEYYGLKLVDLVMPPPDHPVAPLAAWGAGYLNETILSPGEMPPSAYLGLAGLAALAALVVVSLRRVVDRSTLPLEAWLILWIILYSEVGGLNGILGTFGFELFRTTTRYSIFILCLVLMFAVRRLSLLQIQNQLLTYGGAFLVIVFALWEQTPPMLSPGEVAAIAQAVASDRAFTQTMEARLPAQAMVFQIPVIDFPETTVPGVGPYEHFRPYLYSHQLRFSFGSEKGRPQDQWQHDLEKLPLEPVVSRLESYGFSALYVNLGPFPDKGVKLMQAFKKMGRGDMFQSDRGDLLCVVLKSSAQPIPPDNY